jgi:hypothetical protein
MPEPQPSRARLPRTLIASVLLTLTCAALLEVSWLTTLQAFTATAPVPSARYTAPGAAAPGQTFERTETHLLLGRGTLVVHTMPVYTTGPFAHQHAAANSRGLARAIIYDNRFSPWVGLRFRLAVLDLRIPLWIPGAISGAATALLFRRHARRPRPGHCPCGYALDGLASGAVCPECGRSAP